MLRVMRAFGPALILLVASGVVAEQPSKQAPMALLPFPAATQVERWNDGYWFSDGCERVKYEVSVGYPGSLVIKFVLDNLRSQGWHPAPHPQRRFLSSPGVTKSFGRWESWKNVSGSQIGVRSEQWRNSAGDITSYVYWYRGSGNTMEVNGSFCPAAVVTKYQCRPPSPE